MASFAPAPAPKTALGRKRVLSPTCGLRVSPLCLGAMSIGEAWSAVMGSMNKEAAFKLLDAFVDAGGNFIDTANNYQEGESESWLGEWMKERGNRDEMVIATKYTSPHGAGVSDKSNYTGNHAKSMFVSVDASLKKLQTGYIDILYLHFWDWTTSIEEVMQSLNRLVQSGKVLYLGVSDTPAWVVAKANQYARDHGMAQFVVYQGKWSVAERDFERDIIDMARSEGMALCPWNAVGGGKFQSKKAIDERKAKGEPLRSFTGPNQNETEVKISEALDKVGKELGIESVTAVALAYVLQRAPYVFPLIGGRKVEHLHDNIQALSLSLSKEQCEYLESVIPLEAGFPKNFIGVDPHETGKNGFLLNFAGHFDWVTAPKAIGQK